MGLTDKNQKIITYKDYALWNDGNRCEVLDGKIIGMSPPPIPEHQEISMQLSIEMGSYLRGKDCKAFAAPIDVYLFEDSQKNWIDENVKNWVIPDLIVVCDETKIKKSKILGAPDLVVEIISSSSAKIDRIDKRLAYQRAGVREYWIIDPANQLVEVYLLKNKNLELSEVYNRKSEIPVQILENLKIDLTVVFPERAEENR